MELAGNQPGQRNVLIRNSLKAAPPAFAIASGLRRPLVVGLLKEFGEVSGELFHGVSGFAVH